MRKMPAIRGEGACDCRFLLNEKVHQLRSGKLIELSRTGVALFGGGLALSSLTAGALRALGVTLSTYAAFALAFVLASTVKYLRDGLAARPSSSA